MLPEKGRTGAARAAALQTEWGVHRDVATECLRTSGVTQGSQTRYEAIAVANSRGVLATVINNNVTRDARVCTRAGDAERRNRGTIFDSFAEVPMVIAPGLARLVDVHEAYTQFEGITEGIGGKGRLSGTILRNRPGKSGQVSVQGKGAVGI